MKNISPMKNKKTYSQRTEKYVDSKAKRALYKTERANKQLTRGLHV